MARMVRLGPSEWINVPPPCCPACGWGWGLTGPERPTEDWMGCDCAGAERHAHTRWTCHICGAVVADGCTDVTRWHSTTIPAGLPDELRWGVPDDAVRGWIGP